MQRDTYFFLTELVPGKVIVPVIFSRTIGFFRKDASRVNVTVKDALPNSVRKLNRPYLATPRTMVAAQSITMHAQTLTDFGSEMPSIRWNQKGEGNGYCQAQS